MGLCCYCCKGIQHDNSHIEHFRPQDSSSNKTVDYDNIHACCNGGKGKTHIHCGRKKDNWFNEKLTVSPLEPACESLFDYNSNGDIIPANENERAKETIDKLRLNTYCLQTARASVIKSTGLLDQYFDEESRQFWINYFETIEDGKLKPFYLSVLSCLNNYK